MVRSVSYTQPAPWPYRGAKRMGLDLEVVGTVRAVAADETPPAGRAPQIKALRDSHHSVARLLARGLPPAEVSHITGYALSRISSLQRDPTFGELLQHYRYETRDARRDIEALYLGIATDFAQHAHDRLLDEPESVSVADAVDAFKVFADRGGMAPTSRSINKNLNVNIGARLDALSREPVEDRSPRDITHQSPRAVEEGEAC